MARRDVLPVGVDGPVPRCGAIESFPIGLAEFPITGVGIPCSDIGSTLAGEIGCDDMDAFNRPPWTKISPHSRREFGSAGSRHNPIARFRIESGDVGPAVAIEIGDTDVLRLDGRSPATPIMEREMTTVRKADPPMAIGGSDRQVVEAVAVEIADAKVINFQVRQYQCARSKPDRIAIRQAEPPGTIGMLPQKRSAIPTSPLKSPLTRNDHSRAYQ